MSNYKKSAKDIAFDRERRMFKSQIKNLNEVADSLAEAIQMRDRRIKELENIIAAREETIAYLTDNKYTPEELAAHVKRTKSLANTFNILSNGLSQYY